ncbi:MAG TPA: SgcJ/EcaC family oxidoreductase [Terracidiphilus sp.]|nr:SgcJ/EcaC family oxidoreductase [Terracidiphilus sp.]
MKTIAIAIVLFAGAIAAAQSKPDENAIRKILDEEIATWNQGDANAYSRHFAADGTFTNVRGMFFTGRQAFRDRHEVIFKGPFLGTKLQLQVVSLRFLTPDVAICETLSWVSEFKNSPPMGLRLDAKGRLRTRLLQVLAKRDGEWQIVVYHNVDIKPDVDSPEPK